MRLLAALMLLATACSTPEDPTAPLASEATSAGTVTLKGRVFYNDRRNHGRFATRDDKEGNPGESCGTDGVRADGTPCALNLLGARYMVVDVIERDTGYFAPTAWNCKKEDLLASATVAADGTFSATVSASDPCASDAWTSPRLELRVRLRFCSTSYCFSLDESPGKPYTLDHPRATYDAPLAVAAGRTYDVGDMTFAPAGHDPAVAEDHAIAANYYATLVDTVLAVHRDAGVPFFYDDFGEVEVIYPSNDTGSATTKSASRIVLLGRQGWIKGDVVAHEYGHVLQLRAWDGDYGYDGVGVSWSASRPAEHRIAFKEGWANFLARVVLDDMPCDAPAWDDNATKELPGDLGDGASWVTNVNKLLCDWYDTRNDDDPTLAGGGDHFAAADFYSMWQNLRGMYVSHDAYGGDYHDGLWICDWVAYYLDVRKSAAAVGQAAHDGYVDSITDLVYNNNIACGLSSP